MWGAPCAGTGLALVPNSRQQQGVKAGVQSRAVGGVRVQHGVVVPAVDVGVGVRVVDVGVSAAAALRAQAVGPAVGEVGGRRDPSGLRQDVVSPQSSVRVVEGNGAGGEVRVDRDGDGGEAGTGLGWVGGVPHWAALIVREGSTI